MKHEFKVTKSQNQTVYTLESASSGGTSSGSIASSSTALGGVLKRNPPGDNILAQEKKEVPKPRNFVAKNAKMGGAGQHKDKKKAEKQGDVKHRKPFSEASNLAEKDMGKHNNATTGFKALAKKAGGGEKGERIAGAQFQKMKKAGQLEEFNGEYDDEAGMAHSNLLSSSRAVIGLLKTIKDRDNLPEWVQEKIAKAEMMLVGVWDYLQSQKEQGIDPQQDANENRYDRRDAYQRDYDSSVSGMDGSDKHAFKRAELQHELGHETNNIAISINGKLWKVVPGKGYADSREESQYLSNMKRWADTKSASSGKTWTVSLTGANPTEGVAEGSEQSVSLRDMVNVVDEHYPKYYAELSGSNISDKQFERAIINAYKKIMQKQGVAEGERTMSRAAKGNEKYGKDGMRALAKAGREGASEKKLDAIRDKHDNYNEEAKHGLYYNVNKRKAAGTSRPANSSKAPTAQAWKDAAKTAKKESIDSYFESLQSRVEKLTKK